MFTDEERLSRRSNGAPVDRIAIYKDSLFAIFTRLAESSRRVFEVKASINSTTSILVVVTKFVLDDNTNSIVAEAYMWIVDVNVRQLLFFAFEEAVPIVVGNEGMAMWHAVLPSMVDRSREWMHKSNCKYPHGIAFLSGERSICSCEPPYFSSGVMGLPFPGGVRLPSFAIPTPITISPVFSVPYLEKTNGGFEEEGLTKHMESREEEGFARHMASVKIKDEPVEEDDEKKTKCWMCGKGGKLRMCNKCREARYCSRECQARDWKLHKEACGRIAKH
jgi:hypothetical protein